MLKTKKNYLKWIIISLTIFVTIFTNIKMSSDAATLQYTQEQHDTLIRFGITAPLGVVGYDLSEIHALTYLDWAKESSTIPEGVEYIHVLKMRFIPIAQDDIEGSLDETAFQKFLIDLPELVQRNPGAVWIIGNEPDRKEVQDDLTPEKYAERFFHVATKIKETDSSARVGFGSIVQPTPIRIRYLERSLDRLAELAGTLEDALVMIDIWTIHNFILNEQEYSPSDIDYWGADIPPGFICPADCYDAFVVDDFNYSVTYSMEIFRNRIFTFREWLKSIGEQGKPLWITEYGSLFPDWEVMVCYDHPDDCISRYSPYEEWPLESDNIEFMLDTFDYLLHAYNSAIGLPDDGYKLVQRWYWYSLNGYVKIYPPEEEKYSYGGTLFDPDNNKQITNQGIAYKNYIELLIGPKIFLPIVRK